MNGKVYFASDILKSQLYIFKRQLFPFQVAIELTFENRSTVYFPFPDSKRFMNVFQIIM